uniref:(northern house mosquito) hypothetical protein n=1 Tax=Culex pipiens TaxID=7175 RepID=A0A8D8AWN5_CULPI
MRMNQCFWTREVYHPPRKLSCIIQRTPQPIPVLQIHLNRNVRCVDETSAGRPRFAVTTAVPPPPIPHHRDPAKSTAQSTTMGSRVSTERVPAARTAPTRPSLRKSTTKSCPTQTPGSAESRERAPKWSLRKRTPARTATPIRCGTLQRRSSRII